MSELPAVSSAARAEPSARVLEPGDAVLSGALSAAHDAVARYVELRMTPGRAHLSPHEAERFGDEQKAIRIAVATVVAILRERAVTPERVLISLKELLASMPRCDGDVEIGLRQQVIRWAIDDYYGTR
jgi:hypothetical protein